MKEEFADIQYARLKSIIIHNGLMRNNTTKNTFGTRT